MWDNAEVAESLCIDCSDSDESEKVDMPLEYQKVSKQMKNKEYVYDSSTGKCYYECSTMHKYLRQRQKGRLIRFNMLKRKFGFEIPEDMIIKFSDFMYYEKSINYLYFMKKMCDKEVKINKKYESIWNDFTLRK